MDNLKRCPFCGSTKIKIEVKNGGTKYINGFNQRVNRKIFTARCKCCFARGGTASGLIGSNVSKTANIAHLLDTEEDLRERAAELWNTRY